MTAVEALTKLAEIATHAAKKDSEEADAIHKAILVLSQAISRQVPDEDATSTSENLEKFA